jgi:hypothetical protein
MNKADILAEIRRTAAENAGVPLGRETFFQATGIKQTDWYGKHWARWGDALKEAGFQPNQLQGAIPEDQLLALFSALVRKLGLFPTSGEVRLEQRNDPSFPSHNTFARFGSRVQLARRVADYCSRTGGLEDVFALCSARAATPAVEEATDSEPDAETLTDFGFVYLLRSGRFYKIGMTNSAGRRERELAIQLPERATVVHSIRTDDPAGIEAYWHRRFSPKRKNGEWFELDAHDVAAFKRRKFM